MKQIRLNAFEMNQVGHIQQGLWNHSHDGSTEHGLLGPCVELAQVLERGPFDGLFLADVLGVYDNSPSPGIRHTVQNPVGDTLHRTTGVYADPKKGQAVQHAGLHLFSAGERVPPTHPAAAHCWSPA